MKTSKRKYTKYELKKIYFAAGEVCENLNISPWVLKYNSKKLFPHKWENFKKGNRLKYTESEIEAIKVVLEKAKQSKEIKMVNPDHLFDGFEEIVEMQG